MRVSKIFTICLFLSIFILPQTIIAQTIYSDVEFIQPNETDSFHLFSYGYPAYFNENRVFLSLQYIWIDTLQVRYSDGAIVCNHRQAYGSWKQTIIIPTTFLIEFPGTSSAFSQPQGFGNSFSVSGNTLAVGSAGDDFIYDRTDTNRVPTCGSVYIFKLDNNGKWHQETKIYEDVPVSQNNFGRYVVLENDELFIFSIDEPDTTSGSVSIFRKTENGEWKFIQKLKSPEPNKFDWFGHRFAVNGNELVIASTDHKQVPIFGGVLYFYKKDENGLWQKSQTLYNPIPGNGYYNFLEFKFYKDELYLGLPNDHTDIDGNVGLTWEGSVTVFKKNTSGLWELAYKIRPNDVQAHRFGFTFDIYNEHLFVSAVLHDIKNSDGSKLKDAGAVYIFERDKNKIWQEVKKVISPDPKANSYFSIGSVYKNEILLTEVGKFYGPNRAGAYLSLGFHLMRFDTIVNDFEDFVIYPNPTNEYFDIELNTFPKDVQIQLFNLQGELLKTTQIEQFNRKRIYVSSLPSGTYIVRVTNQYRTKSLKLIKL